jgi:hypothetical protein
LTRRWLRWGKILSQESTTAARLLKPPPLSSTCAPLPPILDQKEIAMKKTVSKKSTVAKKSPAKTSSTPAKKNSTKRSNPVAPVKQPTGGKTAARAAQPLRFAHPFFTPTPSPSAQSYRESELACWITSRATSSRFLRPPARLSSPSLTSSVSRAPSRFRPPAPSGSTPAETLAAAPTPHRESLLKP